jgi:hypothetical protein
MGMGPSFTSGISIDLKRPEGLALCFRLGHEMGALLEIFRPAPGPLVDSDYGEPGSVA